MVFSRVLFVIGLGLFFFLAVAFAAPSMAQTSLIGEEEGKEAMSEQSSEPRDPLGRHTPKGFVRGMLSAMADQDFDRAARFLDLSAITTSRRQENGPDLARELKQILDKGGWVAANWQLSDALSGHTDDGLPPEKERFATIRTPDGMVDLIAERIDGPESTRIWIVSSKTVGQIPELAERIETGVLEHILPETLGSGPLFGGVPIGHWIALLVLAVGAYLVAWSITFLGVFVMHRTWRQSRGPRAIRFVNAAILPFRIYLALWIFGLSAIFLGVSVIARQQLGYLVEIIAWLVLGWLLWRIIDALGEIGVERVYRRSQYGMLSAIRFFRRGAKFLIAAIAGIAVLDSLGFDVTAGLAALGIGGIAIALGTQKTVENFVGSLTLIADQPVRVGDFCRFGQVLGTIEDIGMRSTRIRTLDRTVVTVPNGEFSSLQIENFNHRDRFWFHPKLALRYETTPDQIRYLLVELRSVLYAHPRIDPDPVRVRFTGLGADCLNIDIFAYVHAEDYNDFMEVQEDLTLRIMDIVAESGASFAFPSQTLYMAQDKLPPEDKREAAEKLVNEWSENDELQLPRFHPDRIAELQNSFSYPPEGSVGRAAELSEQKEQALPGMESMESRNKPSRSFWKRKNNR